MYVYVCIWYSSEIIIRLLKEEIRKNRDIMINWDELNEHWMSLTIKITKYIKIELLGIK